MRDFKRMLGGLGAKARSGPHMLRGLSGIAEIEAMLDVRGVTWTKAFEEACDRTSLALFGITERDTKPDEPHPDRIEDPEGSRYWFSDKAWSTYDAAVGAWWDWQDVMADFDVQVAHRGDYTFWAAMGYDVTDEAGEVLRCLPRFARQMYAAHKGLLPGARFTPDGGGRRAAQSVEEWGAALAAEAARFRPSR